MYEVDIEAEACVLQCEITSMVIADAHPSLWTSDWDVEGYREMEFRVVSGITFDSNGKASDLGRNGCAALAERYGEYIEESLWKQYDALRKEGKL
ncbi:TPA: hypothetical protein QDZ28_004239 [Pseudomonas putida]|nr:hypothetical protein [Pseudomonas putida]